MVRFIWTWIPAAVASVMALTAPWGAWGQTLQPPELEVVQIGSGSVSGSVEGRVTATEALLSTPPELEVVAPSLLERLPAAGRGNAARIEQAGSSNRAMLIVSGIGNSTLQDQNGVANSSSLVVRGNRNRVAVDQDGQRLNSDISLGITPDGPSIGQTLVHIQRGRGNAVTSQPVPIDGMDGTPLIVVDTSLGRKVFSISDGIGARPVEIGSATR